MNKLMISLDNNILHKNSRSAAWLAVLNIKEKVFVLIPTREKNEVRLSDNVVARGTGGNKISQFLRVIKFGWKIINENGIEEMTVQDPFFAGLSGVILKLVTGVRLEVQLHGDFFSGDYYKKSGFGNLFRYILARYFVVGRADKIRAVGQRIKNSLVEIGFPESKIEVCPVVVNKEEIANYQQKFDLHVKYPGYKKIFVFLGRLDPVKNITWSMDAFKNVLSAHSDYLFLIVGDGAEKKKIENKIIAEGLQANVRMENWTDDPLSYLKTADGFVFASLSEGYGMAVMEAYYAGCPMVMTDVGVANFELLPSDKVKIVAVGDMEQFSNALREI